MNRTEWVYILGGGVYYHVHPVCIRIWFKQALGLSLPARLALAEQVGSRPVFFLFLRISDES